MVDVFWPERPPSDPMANVSTLVSRLRGSLGAELLAGTRSAVGLTDPSHWSLDLDEAAQLVERAEDDSAAGDGGMALAGAEAALRLLGRGSVLEDDPYAEWAAGALSGRRRRSRSAAVAG